MDLVKLTNDGFYILLFLCPGYLGFRMYFIDRPWNSLNPLHVFYGSLVFSIFAYILFGIVVYGVTYFFPSVKLEGSFLYAILASPFAVGLGLLWRCKGHVWFHEKLIRMKVTNEDNNSTPWMQLFNNPKIALTQITVYLKDGSAIRCDDTGCYDTPELRKAGVFSHYTCAEGELYLVANQWRGKDDADWQEVEDIHVDSGWGLKVHWIPAREIARVEARAIQVT